MGDPESRVVQLKKDLGTHLSLTLTRRDSSESTGRHRTIPTSAPVLMQGSPATLPDHLRLIMTWITHALMWSKTLTLSLLSAACKIVRSN